MRFVQKELARLLRFNHHSAVDDPVLLSRLPDILARSACHAGLGTRVEPPTTVPAVDTISPDKHIVVLVISREFHPVMRIACKLERVAGVSAVPGHIQSIFVVELVTDLERPVLGRVPFTCALHLHLHPQSIRLGTGQKVHFLEAEPEVLVLNGSKPILVVSPR